MENWQPSFPNDDQNCLGNKQKTSIIGSMVKIDALFSWMIEIFWATIKIVLGNEKIFFSCPIQQPNFFQSLSLVAKTFWSSISKIQKLSD